jgi:uncharacterized protein
MVDGQVAVLPGCLMEIYLPVAEMSVNWLIIIALGMGVGFLSGMFGVGGGFLMTPLLVFTGIPSTVAVATTLSHVTASSMSGALSQWRRQGIDFVMAGVMLCGGVFGTLAGVWLFALMRRQGQMDLIVALAYVLMLGVVGTIMLRESLATLKAYRSGITPSRRPMQRGWVQILPLKMRFRQSRLYISVIPPIIIGFVVGALSAIMGIGGGFIIVPALLYLFRVPTAVVIGTSQLQILWTAIAALILHAVANQAVDFVLAIMLVLGGVFGSQFGARAGRNLRADLFRFLLALLVLGVGLRFAIELVIEPAEPFSIAVSESRG